MNQLNDGDLELTISPARKGNNQIKNEASPQFQVQVSAPAEEPFLN
jgi:hypothetical protein